MTTSGALHRATAWLLLLLSFLVLVLTVTSLEGGFRLFAVAAFCLTAPGWAVVAFWRPATSALEWTVATCLNIAIVILLSMVMLLSAQWYPEQVMIGLAAVTSAVLVFHLLRTDLTGWRTA